MCKVVLCLVAVLNFAALSAQKSALKFNANGDFKIVQFTDVHYKVDDQVNSQIALDRMNEVLDVEKPDSVIFTGDIVVFNESFKGLDTVLDVCIKRNIMGAFVGHDHNNDYALMCKEVLFAYERYTGGNTVYNDIANGARVIVLKEGVRKFDSYIRLTGGEIGSRISYPDSF